MYKLASVLLQYPTSALFDGLDELDAFAAQTSPKPARAAFGQFLTWLRATPPTEVAQHYVETFDLRRRCALYLTYYRYGDTRKRGMAMIVFKTAYRDAGFVPSEDELPDYLPMVLDFADLCPRGERLLHAHRATWNCCAAPWTKPRRLRTSIVAAVCGAAAQARPPRDRAGAESVGVRTAPAKTSGWNRSRPRSTSGYGAATRGADVIGRPR